LAEIDRISSNATAASCSTALSCTGESARYLVRGVGAYLHDLRAQPDPPHPLRLIDDLDRTISSSDAEGFLQIILQALLENYDHLQDYNLTTRNPTTARTSIGCSIFCGSRLFMSVLCGSCAP